MTIAVDLGRKATKQTNKSTSAQESLITEGKPWAFVKQTISIFTYTCIKKTHTHQHNFSPKNLKFQILKGLDKL